MASLTILSGLSHDVVVVVEGHADKALLAWNVATLGVGVDQASLLFGPLAVAEVLTFLVDLAGVVAVEDGVEHHLGVVAVGVGAGAESLCIWKSSREFSDERTTGWILNFCAAQG